VVGPLEEHAGGTRSLPQQVTSLTLSTTIATQLIKRSNRL